MYNFINILFRYTFSLFLARDSRKEETNDNSDFFITLDIFVEKFILPFQANASFALFIINKKRERLLSLSRFSSPLSLSLVKKNVGRCKNREFTFQYTRCRRKTRELTFSLSASLRITALFSSQNRTWISRPLAAYSNRYQQRPGDLDPSLSLSLSLVE